MHEYKENTSSFKKNIFFFFYISSAIYISKQHVSDRFLSIGVSHATSVIGTTKSLGFFYSTMVAREGVIAIV